MTAHGFVWLASYPVSGAVALRLALARAFLGGDFMPERVSLVAPDFASPQFFDGLFTPAPGGAPTAIVPHWGPAQKRFIAAQTQNQLVQTHNVWTVGEHMLSALPEATLAQIYIIRDPRDVLAAYAEAFKTDHASALAQMLDPDHFIRNTHTHFTEIPGSWPAHVTSWARFTQRPRLVLRYEDMLSVPEKTFAKAFRFLGLPVSSTALVDILNDVGFPETPAPKQAASGWRALDYETLMRPLEAHCAPVMRAYGYTPLKDRPATVAVGG